jgi:DNA-binding CsgD family transcriptional regulator/tetratricopeptide (TPR) repeat protein
MTREEAGLLLADRPPDERAGLIALADGWPAVIGLARRLPRPVDLSAGFPDEVYDFFAEEVYQSLAPETRRALCLFALAPTLDRDLAAALAGPDAVETVSREAEAIGLMTEQQGQLVLHPLAGTFLLGRGTDLGDERAPAVRVCVDYYRANRDWDPLIDVILRESMLDELRDVLADGLSELLDDGRLTTIRSVVEASDRARASDPVIELARAEITLREGNSFAAGAHALRAFEQLPHGDPLSFRTLLLAARAAHIGNREDEAVRLYTRAEEIASSENELREARWGLLSSLSQIESDDAWEVLALLRGDSTQRVPEEIVRDATRCLMMELRSGSLQSLTWGRRASEVVDDVRDPIARCSFRNVFSGALSVYGDYPAALVVARQLQRDAVDHRLKFVVPVAACTVAQALCGMRRYAEAESLVNDALAAGVETRDTLLEPLAAALLIRMRCQAGRLGQALEVSCDLTDSVLSVKGEFLASRALALACSGRHEEAFELATEGSSVTRTIEVRVLERATHAVIGLRSKARDTTDRCRALLDVMDESNGFDLVVASYRSSPELLAFLLASRELRRRIVPVVRRVGDANLLRAVGIDVADEGNPETILSRREFEVYELLCAGLSNRQIAECLFISEETVKAHAHHIFDKLGIRSRQALAIDAARRRGDQATEAT